MTATDAEVEQLAMFTAALNAKLYGYSTDGGPFQPSWEDLGIVGQEAYLKDARLQFEAVELIISKRPTEREAKGETIVTKALELSSTTSLSFQAAVEALTQLTDLWDRLQQAEDVIEKVRARLNPDPNGVPLKDLYAVRDLLSAYRNRPRS